MIADPAVELARRVRLVRQQADEARRAAAWSDHDAYGCHVRGLKRQSQGLERQAARQRVAAADLDALADELESATVRRPVLVLDGSLAL